MFGLIPLCFVEPRVREIKLVNHPFIADSVKIAGFIFAEGNEPLWDAPDLAHCFQRPFFNLEAIAWHHCPDNSDDTAFSLLTSIHAANAVEREKRLQKSGGFVPQIDSNYVQRLGLADRFDRWRGACGMKAVSKG